jgi:PAS domain S-box-containing protein/putative nucleotidyltransferase with HDIG domain
MDMDDPLTANAPQNPDLRILMLEDTVEDAELNAMALREAGMRFVSQRVETRADFTRAIDEFRPDIILSDFRLPAFDGREALRIAGERCRDVPVIMVTGAVGDELAVELLHAGARDYVLKDRLARLPSAVQRAMAEELESRKRKAAEHALRQSEALHRSFIAASPDGVGVIDAQGHVIYASPKVFELLGLDRKTDLHGIDALEWITPEDRDRARANLARIALGEIITDADYRLTRCDGTSVYVEINGAPILDAENNLKGIVTVVRDATARREAVEALRQSEQKYRTIFEESFDGLFVTSVAGKVIDINRKGIQMFGYDSKEDIQRIELTRDVYANPADRERVLAAVNAQGAAEFEIEFKKKSGERMVANFTLTTVTDKTGAVTSYRGIIRDITEKKRAEEALRRSEQRLREVYEKSPLAYQSLDENGCFLDVNPAWCAMMGYNRDEVIDRNVAQFLTPSSVEVLRERYPWLKRQGEIHGVEFGLVRKDGIRLEIELDSRVALDEQGNFKQAHCILHDITERKRAEKSLHRFNRALKTLSSGNEALVRANNEQELLENMCRVLVSFGGYRSVWIGYADPKNAALIRAKAWAGHEEGCFSLDSNRLQFPTADDPVSVTLRAGAPCVTHDIATDPAFAPCREDALRAGFKSSVTLPLRDDQAVLGALTIYSIESDAFDDEEVKLLAELANDLTYGVQALRTRIDKERGLIRLQVTMEATIQALANTVELRDPYTAGHQQRVARLVTAIARKLHLTEDRLLGLRLAAMVHDVGKIFVPAEILSRPGKLSIVEYSLVQTHVEAGYEILNAIDFPWPIANIVRQHHERLDGSGYPHGLKGDAILQEARILSVADTVEAMSAHRPYRPGLGLEAALNEIGQGSGRLYDADAVRACVEVFRDGEFRFE